LLRLASSADASVASILVPSAILAELFSGFAFADADEDFATDPLPEACVAELPEAPVADADEDFATDPLPDACVAADPEAPAVDADEDLVTEPLPEACVAAHPDAPELFVCTAACDWSEAEVCADAPVCAEAVNVASMQMAANDRTYFIRLKSSPSSDLKSRPKIAAHELYVGMRSENCNPSAKEDLAGYQ
jgi:hypothetical protein